MLSISYKTFPLTPPKKKKNCMLILLLLKSDKKFALTGLAKVLKPLFTVVNVVY
jgi:hypothetical protein